MISRKNRKSTSKSRSRSPRSRCRSKSRSQSRTKPSKSRSVSRSRSDLKDELQKTESIKSDADPAVDSSTSCAMEMQKNVSQNTTENGKSPTMAVNSFDVASISSSSGFNTFGVTGSWRPVPFLAETSVTKSSQKCITPEVPLEVTNVSEEPSTVTPKDSECAANPDKTETNTNPITAVETLIERNSTSPSKSPSQEMSSRSKVAARSRSKSSSRKRKSKSRSPSPKKSHKARTRSKRSKSRSPKKRKSRSRSQGRRRKSRTPDRSRRSKSRKRSRSHSRRRSRSGSRWRRGGFGSRSLNQRDRWKREPSRSPVLILRKKSSTSRPRRSTSKTPPRLTELGMKKLLNSVKILGNN